MEIGCGVRTLGRLWAGSDRRRYIVRSQGIRPLSWHRHADMEELLEEGIIGSRFDISISANRAFILRGVVISINVLPISCQTKNICQARKYS